MQAVFLENCLACIARMQKNDNFTGLQSMQGILHITALQPCLLKTFFRSGLGNGGGQVSYPKKNRAARVTHLFEGFSHKIQFICTFRHPNNGYSMKKYIGSGGLQT